MTREESVRRLAALGDQRRSLRAKQAALRTATRDAILAADDLGVSITEIARLLGMSRPAVYDLLAEADR